MSGLEGVLTFNFSGQMGRTNFLVDPPLHVDGNRVTLDTSGIVSEIVAGTNVTVDNTDPTHPIVSAAGSSAVVESVVAGTNVTVDNTDPANPIVSASGVVESVVAGTNVTVDNTDPANPIVNASGGGGGTVDSVVAGTGISVNSGDPANPIVSLDSTAVGAIRVLSLDIPYTSFNTASFTIFTPTGSDVWLIQGIVADGTHSTDFTGGGDGVFSHSYTYLNSVVVNSRIVLGETLLATASTLGFTAMIPPNNYPHGAVFTASRPFTILPNSFTPYTGGSLRVIWTMIKVA